MKKYLIFLIAPIIILTASFVGCGVVEEDNPPEETESVTYSAQTNPYAVYEWSEFPDITDWDSRLTEGSVYYEFEGIYQDVFMSHPNMFIYLNCYEDGALHAIFYGVQRSDYYGYWTNVDAKGNPNLVLHILNCDGKQYNRGDYDVECDQIKSDYYEYGSSEVIFETYYGICRIYMVGSHYSPVVSLAVSAEKKDVIIGQDFSLLGHTVTLTRANGTSREYDWYDLGPRFTLEGFDSSKAGTCEVSVSYFGTDAQTSYKCKVHGIREITATTWQGGMYPGQDFEDYCQTFAICAIRNDYGKVDISNASSTCSFKIINQDEDGSGEIRITYLPTGHSTICRYFIYDD